MKDNLISHIMNKISKLCYNYMNLSDLLLMKIGIKMSYMNRNIFK